MKTETETMTEEVEEQGAAERKDKKVTVSLSKPRTS